MVSGSLSTITKIQNLLRTNLSATQFAGLCQAYGFEGITTQWLSRTVKSGKLNHDTDVALRPLILQIENLVERARPIPVSFENIESVKFLLDIISMGLDISAGVIQRTANSSTEVTDNSADNPLVEPSGI